jgi:hypothetical protein
MREGVIHGATALELGATDEAGEVLGAMDGATDGMGATLGTWA